ncbi:MAG: cadherin domain-containing protein [Cyclobacteriaceae bacterium]
MKRILAVLASVLIVGLSCFFIFDIDQKAKEPESRKLPRAERKKARYEYFLNKLKDPQTNEIPLNVRTKEMAFASAMRQKRRSFTDGSTGTHEWAELGPSDVGGRTRALALDVRNSDIVLAAGVSGGIWKSTDGAETWASKLPNGSNLSISFLAQDPVDNDVWYATTGEVSDGGSASGKGQGNSFNGSGIYKSTDNGETWSLLTYEFVNATSVTKANSPNTDIASNPYISPFRLTSKVFIHDFQGIARVFICTYFYGIWVSSDGGDTFNRFAANLSNNEDPLYSDIIVDGNGLMTVWFGPTSTQNGFFRSLDGGTSFTNLTPPDYSVGGQNARCILSLAPSQESTVYAFLYDNPGTGDEHYFYLFDYSGFDSGGSATFSNRSNNLPTFPESIFDEPAEFTTQGGYDMTLTVHPSDPDFVVLGYVELIKSEDGFATNISDNPAKFWIGGNENPDRIDEEIPFGKTHHADQHILFFDPNSPDTLWSGHDGGISKTTDVTADRVIWESKNNDYNVTQYYTVSIGRDKEETEVIGGTQDNGTPLLEAAEFSGVLIPSLTDLSSGDGAYCFFGSNLSYASSQNGNVDIYAEEYFSSTKRDITHLFIHPFAVDPNDEGTLFYTSFGDGLLARNNQIDEAVAQDDPDQLESGWEDFDINNAVNMSAIKVSDQNPSHKLYFGGLLNDTFPVLFSWEDANTSTDVSNMAGKDLSGDVAAGSWLNDIAINPEDGNEIILVYSNYNITGLFHSTDGGETLTAIEGNLSVNDDQGASGFTGPSMRAAEIVVDWQGNQKYYVATSIGLYYTEALDGSNTEWTLETELLNNVVIEDLDSRPSDNTIVAGTHGRGIFLGQKLNIAPVVEEQTFELDENTSNDSAVGTVVFVDPEGEDVTITFSDGNKNDAFSIDNTGAIVVNNIEELDFETTPIFNLSVSIDDGEATVVTTVTINLKDINDAPTFEDQSFSVDENSEENAEIGTVVSSDQDNDALTYSIISGNDDGFFSIEEGSGIIKVGTDSDLNFETKSTYDLTVQVSDGELNQEATITISINDINEAPEISDQALETDEGLDNGSIIATVSASDPENDDLTYSLKSGNTDDAFSINGSTGEITVNNVGALEFDVNPSFQLIVEITDGEFTAEATISVTLIEVILSVEEKFLNSLSIYPNPAKNYLTVNSTMMTHEELKIEITNMLGQNYLLFDGVHTGEFHRRFDLRNFSKGYYLLNFKYSDKTLSRKLIIQ